MEDKETGNTCPDCAARAQAEAQAGRVKSLAEITGAQEPAAEPKGGPKVSKTDQLLGIASRDARTGIAYVPPRKKPADSRELARRFAEAEEQGEK
jgi:hypothetical protein